MHSTPDAYALLDHLPNGCVIVASDRTIVFWNQVMERWTCRARSEVLGRDLYEAFPLLATARYRIRIEQTLTLGVPNVFSALLSDSLFGSFPGDGVRRFEQATITRAQGASGPEMLFTITDVTEQYRRGEKFREETRRATEEAAVRRLREAELKLAMTKAEEATRTKSLFLASMSHELRTPMNGVLGMADIVLGTTLTPFQREHLEILKTSASSLLTVLNDILDFSKIEANKLELEEIAYDPRRMVEESVCIVAEMAHAKDVEVAAIVAADVPDQVVGDPVRFRQVLVNLLSNAVKFTAMGEIVVELAADVDGEDLVLRCVVRDTGPGIAEPTRVMLFEPFVQANASTSRLHGGTGLGLSICRRLVHMMRGDISVASKVGVGSRFDFHVRVRPCAVDELRPQRALKVAIMLSHPASAESLAAQVESRGIRNVSILTAGSKDTLRLESFTHFFVDAISWAAIGIDARERIAAPDARATSLIFVSRVSSAKEVPVGFHGTLGLPCRRSAVDEALGTRAPVAVEAPMTAISALRVLVAEDNRINQVVARAMLTKLGCEVVMVDDGRAAVETARRERFDIVLMDMQMPEMSGCEASARLRAEGFKVPIIALTASALSEDRDACLAAGMDDFVPKPFDRATLVKVIDRWSRPAA